MRVAVVGAGPAGSSLALRLARQGASVTVYDPSFPREKPCGGGLTRKALELLPPSEAGDPLPARRIHTCLMESGADRQAAVELELRHPIAVASRRELDAWLLRHAEAAGAVHVPQRVLRVEGRHITTARGGQRYDVVVGADGASSLVRSSFLAPTPTQRLAMAVGWHVSGDSPLLVGFQPGLAGYHWLFPRRDHVSVGICAPLGAQPTRELVARLTAEVARRWPRLAEPAAARYAQTIPSPSSDPGSILEIAGEGWALVGDAAALADPITGEGIHFALRSARVLAQTLCETGSTVGYPERALEDFGRELLEAARLRERFYAPGFTTRMLRYSARSAAIREVLGELVLGSQGYLGLKGRLLRAAPRFVWESLWSRLG